MINEKMNKTEKVLLYIILVICIFGGVIFGYITSEIKNYSGIENLKKFQPNIPTRLYDVNGELIAELFQEKDQLAAANTRLLKAEPLPGFLIIPEEQEDVSCYLETLFNKKIQGRSLEDILNNK